MSVWSEPVGRRGSRAVRGLVGGALVLVLAAVTVLTGAGLSPAQAFTKWQSGVATGQCGAASLADFSTWRHAKVERTSGYLTPSTWAGLTTLKGLGTCAANGGVPVTLSIGMLPGTNSKGVGTLKNGALGKYNKYWKAFGEAAVANGYSHATLRLGWEMNGAWFRWSAAKDPKHWASYWRMIVTTLRKVPGQHFTFEWSPGLGTGTSAKLKQMYPGDKYVSYVGSTVYDQWWGNPSATVAQRWQHLTDQSIGLTWLAAFAKSHHKKIGIAEWGLASKTSFSGHGDGDNPYFVTHFYAWLKNNNAAYDVYFNRLHSSNGNEHRLAIGTQTNATFKAAASAYRKTFGGL